MRFAAGVTISRGRRVACLALLVAGSIGAVHCGGGSDSTAIEASELLGSYDAEVVGRGDSVASVEVAGDAFEVVIRPISGRGFTLAATRLEGGKVDVEGSTSRGDVLEGASGSGTIAKREGLVRWDFTVETEDEAFAIILERPTATALGRFSGAYIWRFDKSIGGCDCSSSMELVLTVSDLGLGSTAAGTDIVDSTGENLGILEAGTIIISPRGQVRISSRYLPEDPQQLPPVRLVVLQGMLSDAGGAGRTRAGEFSPAESIGGWTATRVSP